MPVLAYLAATIFGNPRPASRLLRRSRLARREKAQPAVLALAIVTLCLGAPDAVAQGTPGKQDVRIGFRADAEPFSYKIEEDGGMQAGTSRSTRASSRISATGSSTAATIRWSSMR